MNRVQIASKGVEGRGGEGRGGEGRGLCRGWERGTDGVFLGSGVVGTDVRTREGKGLRAGFWKGLRAGFWKGCCVVVDEEMMVVLLGEEGGAETLELDGVVRLEWT